MQLLKEMDVGELVEYETPPNIVVTTGNGIESEV